MTSARNQRPRMLLLHRILRTPTAYWLVPLLRAVDVRRVAECPSAAVGAYASYSTDRLFA